MGDTELEFAMVGIQWWHILLFPMYLLQGKKPKKLDTYVCHLKEWDWMKYEVVN